jgi:hypothetical protein
VAGAGADRLLDRNRYGIGRNQVHIVAKVPKSVLAALKQAN